MQLWKVPEFAGNKFTCKETKAILSVALTKRQRRYFVVDPESHDLDSARPVGHVVNLRF